MPSITMPQPGGDISTATVTRWLKRPGDSFSAGEALVELEAEEMLIVVEAVEPGRLTAILVEPGQTIQVGGDLAQVESAIASKPAAPAMPSAEKSTPVGPASPVGKVTPLLMPQAGNTMEEGTVLSWLVKEGDQIKVGQIICEIETDKATIEYESPEAGRLARIIAKANETVPVKELIALLAENDADADGYLTAQGTTAPASQGSDAAVVLTSGASASAPSGGATGPIKSAATVTAVARVKASPAARKIAAQRGLDLASLGTGRGPGGRILSTDAQNANVAAVDDGGRSGSERRKPLSKMRRAIGLSLQKSKQTIPHFYVRRTIDADPLLTFYRQQKPQTSCTVNDVIVLAVGRAMRDFPAVRSQIADNEIVEFAHANVGIAVGVDEGLIVPVVLNVDTLSLFQLAVETKRVVENGRKGKLENVGKGNFTITNLGMFGVDEFSAIINPPESGILAVGAVRETVMVDKGAMRLGNVLTLTLSADHRVVDGVLAAKFMARLKEILENPARELT